MMSKLAVWSWILPIIGIVQLNILYMVLDNGPLLMLLLGLALLFLLIEAGMIFSIVSLVLMKTNRKSELTGTSHAIAGIIINALSHPYAAFAVLGLGGG